MSTNTDPNAERKPNQPFRYKPGTLLEPSESLQLRMLACGTKNLTQEETAAVLGVSADTLQRFWKEHPDHRQAFDDGKQMRKVKLRATLDMHAQLDAGTARFLAKNELGLSDDPSKAKLDEQATKTLKGMSRAEADKRILELTPKLIGSNVSRETYTTQDKHNGPEPDGAGDRQGEGEAPGGGRTGAGAIPAGLSGDQDRRARAHPAAPAPPQEAGAVERLQVRLAELEASAVRKNPRKDGAPHTDRTKASVAVPANTRQERGPAHAPSRLPGRLGSR